MKLYILCFLLAAFFTSAADPISDSLKPIKESIVRLDTTLSKQSELIKKLGKPNVASIENTKNSFLPYLIVFLPVILFLFILVTILVKLNRDDVKLSDILIDKDFQMADKKEQAKVEVAKANASMAFSNAISAKASAFQAAGQVPQIAEVAEPPATPAPPAPLKDEPQSTSRLILFISGVTSVALAVCITTFYFYRWSLGEKEINISSLSTVLYGLGLGILPYGFSKISSALK